MSEQTAPAELAPFEDLVTLSRTQLEALRIDDLDTYLNLAAQREIVMQSMPPLEDASLGRQARALLETTVELDSQSDLLIREGLAKVKAEMGQLRQGHQAIRGYQTLAAPVRAGALA